MLLLVKNPAGTRVKKFNDIQIVRPDGVLIEEEDYSRGLSE